jgi:hypothetical protein
VLHAYLAALVFATTAFVAAGCGGTATTPTTATSSQTAASTTTAQTTTASSGPKQAVIHLPKVKLASGAPLSTAGWIERGDAICAHLNTELSAQTIKTAREFARVLPPDAVYEQTSATELMRLVPPAPKDKDWTAIIATMLRVSADSAQLGRAAVAGTFNINSPLVSETDELHHLFDQLAQRDGFKVCSTV